MSEPLESISPRLSPSPAETGGQEQNGQRRANARSGGRAGAESFGDSLQLSPEARQQLSELQQRDAEVRAHEQAHMSAGGAHVTGGANYTYQKGPDGKQYAVGGSVGIDVSAVPGNPEATEEKARQVRRAALAPGEPSSQDQQVAVKAATLEAEARSEKAQGKGKNGDQQSSDGAGSNSGTVAQTGRAEGPSLAQPGTMVGAAAGVAAGQNVRATSIEDELQAVVEAAARQRGYGPDGKVGGASSGYLFAAGDAADTADRANAPLSRATRRAAESYAASAMQGAMPTALAPFGTGISLSV